MSDRSTESGRDVLERTAACLRGGLVHGLMFLLAGSVAVQLILRRVG